MSAVGGPETRTVRGLAALCGVAGPAALTVYFAAPAFANWPYAGAPAARLVSYAMSHSSLFYAGAWFQVTGTLLCVIFFATIVRLAGDTAGLSGVLVLVGATTLIGLVLVEAALLVAVPAAAAAGDIATTVTTFDLSNGAFVRVFPLAPASLTYLALGLVIVRSGVLHRRLAFVAVALGIAFEVAGLLAVVSSAGLIVIVVLSVAQELWIVSAAVGMWRAR